MDCLGVVAVLVGRGWGELVVLLKESFEVEVEGAGDDLVGVFEVEIEEVEEAEEEEDLEGGWGDVAADALREANRGDFDRGMIGIDGCRPLEENGKKFNIMNQS